MSARRADSSTVTQTDVRDARAWLCMTQEEFGSAIFTPRVTVARWEAGASEPGNYGDVVVAAILSVKRANDVPLTRAVTTIRGAKDASDLLRRLFVDLGA